MLSWIDKLAQAWLDLRLDYKARYDDNLRSTRLTKAQTDENGFTAVFISPTVGIIAEECAKTLNKAEATNYVQFDMLPRASAEFRPVRVTVQWIDGESPAEQNSRLRKELEELKKEMTLN